MSEGRDYDDELPAYVLDLEDTIELLQTQIEQMNDGGSCSRKKSEGVAEFFCSCKAALQPDEIVLLCLKLAGFSYSRINCILGPLSKSSIHRKVHQAKIRLSFFLESQKQENDNKN